MTDIRTVLPEGLPHPCAIVPTAAPTGEGILPVLALAVGPDADRAELDTFLKRHRFVRRYDTARAADSQARWTYEADGRVLISFLAEDGAAQIVLPPHPNIHTWAALTRGTGGTLSLMVLPDMPPSQTLLRDIGTRISPQGDGEYWHLSVGHIPAQEQEQRT
ncbi:hypothetical protein ACIRPQ_29210 [Streptomyces sp. NPDC101213]|uniref:hypothetical protein n=1 Tax=Streptomyces sp. NPDC101213 TaxID=3366130 RepID=UPI0037FE351D